MIKRVSELQAAQRANRSLRNLLQVLMGNLELGARLPLLIFEAEEEGADGFARVLRSLATSQMRDEAALLEVLTEHLTARDVATRAAPAAD